MTDHEPIHNPEEMSETEYALMESKLFSDETESEELEAICMKLAHIPSARAREILERFSQTEKSKEVEWLDIAQMEQEFHFFSPGSDQEELDMVAWKLYYEKEKEIFHIEGELIDLDYENMKLKVEYKAYQSLRDEAQSEEERKDLDIWVSVFHDLLGMNEGQIAEKREHISRLEKLRKKLKENIVTEKMKTLPRSAVEHFHFDGEKWEPEQPF
jgi:hypothetical protein